ncbi:transglycosylase SLT domain-containing protein [Aliiglaciecola litoralis]|uniref:Transglycosylase SLT domain-containing protein n=1 Tax=Aliiglaciecola litoralis TaxID=582857 RepID=A0ABP3X1J4_9ALTE
MKFFNMTSRTLVTAALVLSLPLASAQQAQDPFEELEQEISKLESEGSTSDIQAFQAWKENYLAEYQAFRQEHFQRIDDIRDHLINTWGESDPQRASEAVLYSSDKQAKTVVDFENNVVRVSILHNATQQVDSSQVENIIEETINSADFSPSLNQDLGLQALKNNIAIAVVTEKGTDIIADPKGVLNQEIEKIESQSREQAQQVEKIVDMALADPLAGAPDLDASTKTKVQSEIAQINKEKQARIRKLIQNTSSQEAKKKREALKDKKVTTYTMPLQQANFIKKAEPFREYVSRYSERWDLSESLLFAIMHTESYFNPVAQSHVPAFGLMQIVPRSAGLDVNRFLHKKDAVMTKEYLFQPANNIETGIAYMHILDSRYLAKITNKQSRIYCMIAAYNTGAGNVAKTFNIDGSRNINKAATLINQMTPQQVYQRLVTNLPYKETQQYLEKVAKRQSIYASFDRI